MGLNNGKIEIWDWNNCVLKRSLDNGHFKQGKSCDINSLVILNREYLVSGSADCSIIIWNIKSEDFNIVKRLKYQNSISSLTVLNEREIIVTHSKNVSIYNFSTNNSFDMIKTGNTHRNTVSLCAKLNQE